MTPWSNWGQSKWGQSNWGQSNWGQSRWGQSKCGWTHSSANIANFQWFSKLPSPLNGMVEGNHWDQWFSDDFGVRQPFLMMVFDGCASLVQQWNGQLPSSKSISFHQTQPTITESSLQTVPFSKNCPCYVAQRITYKTRSTLSFLLLLPFSHQSLDDCPQTMVLLYLYYLDHPKHSKANLLIMKMYNFSSEGVVPQ